MGSISGTPPPYDDKWSLADKGITGVTFLADLDRFLALSPTSEEYRPALAKLQENIANVYVPGQQPLVDKIASHLDTLASSIPIHLVVLGEGSTPIVGDSLSDRIKQLQAELHEINNELEANQDKLGKPGLTQDQFEAIQADNGRLMSEATTVATQLRNAESEQSQQTPGIGGTGSVEPIHVDLLSLADELRRTIE